VIALLLSCASPDYSLQSFSKSDELMAHVHSSSVTENEAIELTVKAQFDSTATQIEIISPTAEGMQISLSDGPREKLLGSQRRQTWLYTLSAKPGSYVIYPGELQIDDTPPITVSPIFVDVAIQGPHSELLELDIPPEPSETSWGWLYGVSFASLIFVGVGVMIWKRWGVATETQSPVQVAQQSWFEVKNSEASEHKRAVALSQILRQFLESRSGQPVLNMGPSELQDWLVDSQEFGPMNTTICRLLLALDGFKFAREGGGEKWFAAQEEQFLSIIQYSEERV
jgi:hypothetical protein